MDIENVKLFLALSERLNYTETARALDISQSTLSRKIKALEEQLKVELFHRRGSSVTLTSQGEYLLQSAEQILGLIDTTIEHLHIERKGESGLIRIGCLGPMAKLLVQATLPEFRRKFPNVQIHINTMTPSSMALTDDVDMLITPFLLPDELMVAHTLERYNRYCYASPQYLSQHGRIQYPHDLELHSCIAHTNTPSVERYWELENQSGMIKQVAVHGNYTVNTVDIATELAVGGFGIGLLPENLALEHIKSGALVRLFDGEWSVPGKLYLLHRQNTHMPRRFKSLIEHIKAFFKGSIQERYNAIK